MESKMSRLQLSCPEDATDDVQDGCDIETDYTCEYREEIWSNLLEQEAQKPQINLTSPQLEFRAALVSQLRLIRRALKLTYSTLHAAVQLLDLFMDRHELRTDRLTHSALACLSLAAKSEEKFSRAPRLSVLSKASGVSLSAKTFRQLEWMVGQHVRWRLLMPTAATFASLMAGYVVTDEDLVSRNPAFIKKFKRDGIKKLESYLDLSLSDVRLKVMGAAEVGCACVACARAALGLAAWPDKLANTSKQSAAQLAPVARLLHGMMKVLKQREEEADHGYGSARTTPNLTPAASPERIPTKSRPPTETCIVTRDQIPQQRDFKPDLNIRNCERLSSNGDYPCYRSQKILEASLEILENKGVKRAGCRDLGFQENKRYRVNVPSHSLL